MRTRLSTAAWMPDVVSHPGETLRDLLEERGLTFAWLAHQLGVSKARISHIAGRNPIGGIGAMTALRLEALGFGNARFWLHRQADHDLWLARRASTRKSGRPLTAKGTKRRRTR